MSRPGRVTPRRAACAIALALTCAMPSFAADAPQGTLHKIIESRLIRLGYQKDLPPFSFTEADGKPKGYTVELCQRIVSRIRNEFDLPLLDVQWIEVSSSNRFQRVADGTIDLECGASAITLTRMRQVDFSAMTWIDRKALLIRRNTTLRTIDDLADKKVALVAGTTTEHMLREVLLHQVLDGGHTSTQLVLVKDRKEGLDALVSGAVDALAADQMVLAGLARTAPAPDQLALAEYQFGYETYGLAMRRNDADFRFAVNQVLATLYRTGEVKEIYGRWFGKLGTVPVLLDSLYDLNGLRD